MSRFSNRQEAVINRARRMLKKEPWYRGVCVNRVPSEQECKRNPRRAMLDIYLETHYYDGQWWV